MAEAATKPVIHDPSRAGLAFSMPRPAAPALAPVVKIDGPLDFLEDSGPDQWIRSFLIDWKNLSGDKRTEFVTKLTVFLHPEKGAPVDNKKTKTSTIRKTLLYVLDQESMIEKFDPQILNRCAQLLVKAK